MKKLTDSQKNILLCIANEFKKINNPIDDSLGGLLDVVELKNEFNKKKAEQCVVDLNNLRFVEIRTELLYKDYDRLKKDLDKLNIDSKIGLDSKLIPCSIRIGSDLKCDTIIIRYDFKWSTNDISCSQQAIGIFIKSCCTYTNGVIVRTIEEICDDRYFKDRIKDMFEEANSGV